MKIDTGISSEEYFQLPKKERESYGFYKKRFISVAGDSIIDMMDKTEKEQGEWKAAICKLYPVQYFFREMIWENICEQGRHLKWRFDDKYYSIKNWIKNPHKDIRAKIPRAWTDISTLIVDVNLQFIISFYKEAKESYVDWENGHQKEFMDWLEQAYKDITETIPSLEKEFEIAEAAEKKIEQLKNKIIKEMVERRDYFWT